MKLLFVIAALWMGTVSAEAKIVRYELEVTRRPVNLSGKKEVGFALMVNGGIPAPTLEFTEGDEAEILVKNNLDEEVSIHWHGILLPPEEDGVAYVNTHPIHGGASRTFRFKIRQHGTYWYHSHTGLQEQKGVYGAFIIHPKKPALEVDHDLVAVLSDWSDENPDQILKNLRKDGDYYLYKKDSVRSYLGALKAGGLGVMLKNEWDRMGGMDLSDVGYDAFLINGKKDSQLAVAHPGEKVRLRVINAGASSYFYVSLGQAPFQVIAADGVDTKPVWTREILMGMAETYDILFEIPEHKNYELRATVQDGTGHASGWIGMGEKVSAPDRPLPDLYAPMDHGGGHAGHASHAADAASPAHAGHGSQAADAASPAHAGHASHAAHAGHGSHTSHAKPQGPQGPVVNTLTVDQLEAPSSTALPSARVHEVKLVLGGDMERYVWHINGKAIHEDRTLLIQEGDVVRYTFVNETMMHHPMHLHGHFFRVLNQAGERSPLKHTVDVPPHGERTIEFYANEPGEWMLHCHNLYHMKTGMARVVKYSSFRPSAAVLASRDEDPHQHDHIYWGGKLAVATNEAGVELQANRTWDVLELEVEAKDEDKWEVEGDLTYRRYLGQFLNLQAGGTSFEDHQRAFVGVGYTLPMLVEADLRIDSKGDLRIDAERRFQWTKDVFTEGEITWRQHEDLEWKVNLMYGPAWNWAAGLILNDEKVGVGAQVRF